MTKRKRKRPMTQKEFDKLSPIRQYLYGLYLIRGLIIFLLIGIFIFASQASDEALIQLKEVASAGTLLLLIVFILGLGELYSERR